MPKYRKKPVVIEAEQWFPGKEIEGVNVRDREIIFSRGESHYYVSINLANCDAWLPVDKGEILPFAFYEVKSGRFEKATEDNPLVKKYLEYAKVDKLPPPYAWIKTLEGNHEVSPGDWIITGVKGEKYPCKPDIFEMTYEKVEEPNANK